MIYKMKKASRTWMKLGTMLMLYLVFILTMTGCGKEQVQYLDFPEEMAGQGMKRPWQNLGAPIDSKQLSIIFSHKCYKNP